MGFTMSDDLEELDLDALDIDAEGNIVKNDKPPEPTDTPREIKGSASLIDDYRTCPAKAYGRITRQPQEKGLPLFLGTSVHTTLEKFAKSRGQIDAVETFKKELKFEAERNNFDLKNKEGEDATTTGIRCVSAGVTVLSSAGRGVPLYQRLDPEYIERFFVIYRNGRKYVGKMDLITPINDWERYVIVDYKTGKNAPDPYELKESIQFSMYDYAAFTDESSTRTYGMWPERDVYLHLRGQSTEFHPSGKRKSAKDSKKPLKYDFPSKRTPQDVERHFNTVIEPAMAAMEAGVWFRGKPENCSWCGFFDKAKQRCTVQLPGDTLNLDDYVETKRAEPNAQPLLFSEAAIVASRKAGLKPYTDESHKD